MSAQVQEPGGELDHERAQRTLSPVAMSVMLMVIAISTVRFIRDESLWHTLMGSVAALALVISAVNYRRIGRVAVQETGVTLMIASLMLLCIGMFTAPAATVIPLVPAMMTALIIAPQALYNTHRHPWPWGRTFSALYVMTMLLRAWARDFDIAPTTRDFVLIILVPPLLFSTASYVSRWLHDHLRRALAASQEAQAKLLDVDVELELANRAKSEFLTKVTHELRTPLNTILGYSELLEEEGGMDPDLLLSSAQKDISSIQESARHMLDLVDDLLDLSHLDAGMANSNLTWFSPSDLFEELTQTTRTSLQPAVQLRMENALPATSRWMLDQDKLARVLSNLLDNAAKFTDAGEITLRALPHGAHGACIEVEDTGAGIESAHQEKVFERFQQADNTLTRVHEGTGLGLALCAEIAQFLGWNLSLLRSVQGEGSTFRLVIPKTSHDAYS